MDYDYPILRKVIKHYKNIDTNFDNFYLVSCQHFLEPQTEMYKGFIEIGIKPENIVALGKIYSTNKEVLEKLKSLGIKAFQPEFSDTSFDEDHRNNCKEILNLVVDKKIVILDDGAEMINVFSESNKDVLFAVEQTSSGFRKLENIKHGFPIVNVARSKTKLVQESPLIARLCFERINKYVRENSINNPSFVLVGLGPIGESIREIFKESDFKFSAYDKKDYSSIVELFNRKKPNIVIGATGSQIITKEEIKKLVSSHNFHFISVSSSDREFPVSDFRNHSNIHQDVVAGNITFVNNGFPITFKGNKYEQTPVEIEKTICLLFGAIAHGIKIGYSDTSLMNVPESLEDLINS